MTRLIFLDLARRCGVAHTGPVDGVPVTHLLVLPKVDGDHDGRDYGPLFGRFRKAICELITIVKPDVLGFEAAINVMGAGSPAQAHRTNMATIRVLYGLATLAEEVAWAHNLRCYEVAISTIKKHMTGNGRAEKGEMVRAVQRLGWDIGTPPDDNRADAAAGYSYLASLIDPKFAPRATPLFSRGAA